jgi:hypothetical protein
MDEEIGLSVLISLHEVAIGLDPLETDLMQQLARIAFA